VKEEELRIREYVSRPRRYANIDGLNELTWGAMCCGFYFVDWLHAIVPRDSLWHRPWAQGVCMVAMVGLVYLAGKALKRYVTYPRTGFVAYPDTVKRRMVPVVTAAAAAATAFVIAAVVRGGHLRMETILGAVNFVFYAMAAQPFRPWKYGFLLLIAAGTFCVADAYALLFFGLVFLASGVTTLTLYLRQTRATQ
jgi:hypothetical protein